MTRKTDPNSAQAVVAPKKTSYRSLLQNPGGFRFMVGDVEITALSDGTVAVDYHHVLTNVTPETIDSVLSDLMRPTTCEASITAFLVKTGNRIILVDTGAGEVFGSKVCGNLLSALAANAVQPDRVTDILITHVHSDHSGGLARGGQKLFANAKIHIAKPDVDFFLKESNAAKTGYPANFFEEAIATVKPYQDAGQIQTFSGDTEVIPGIKAKIIGGHTPGSTLFTLETKGEQITFIGDIIHFDAQLPRPETTDIFDVNPDGALKNRAEYFKKRASEKTLLASPHLNFPGVGHLKTDAAGYRWLPLYYTNRSFE